MNHSLRAYRKALKSRLRCCAGTRRRLLTQFDQMSVSFLAENPSPSQAQFSEAFGTPQELAEQLMEEVSEQERRQYRRGRRLFWAVAAVLVLLLSVYALWMTFDARHPIQMVEQIIIYEEDVK